MKKRSLRKIGLVSAIVGFLSVGLFACGNVAVMAQAEDSSSSSQPMQFSYPIDYYPSEDVRGTVPSDWVYVGELEHNFLGAQSSGLISPNYLGLYVLKHVSITYDGYGEYNGATWQQFRYASGSYINYSSLRYPYLVGGASACWFALYWGNSGHTQMVYDCFNFCPEPLWTGQTTNYSTNFYSDSSYAPAFCRRIYGVRADASNGFYLTDESSDEGIESSGPCTHWLDNMVWTYAQAYVRDGRPAGWAYQQGYTAGNNDGKNQGYNTGYNAGYNAGKSAVTDSGIAVTNLFGAVASVPISVLNGLSGFVIWNVPLISLCVTFLFIGIVLWIVKKFI